MRRPLLVAERRIVLLNLVFAIPYFLKPGHRLGNRQLPHCMRFAATFSVAFVLCSELVSDSSGIDNNPTADSKAAEINNLALNELKRALRDEPRFVKLHAAEALLAGGYNSNVCDVFKKQLELYGNVPMYRIAIWRVLAQAGKDAKERSSFIEEIRNAYLDPNAPDRTTAAESLAKLHFVIPAEDRPIFKALARDAVIAEAPCRRWLVAVSGDEDDVRFLAELLSDPDPAVRGITAYALRFLTEKLPTDVIAKLTRVAEDEPTSNYRIYLVTAAYAATRDNKQVPHLKKTLLSYARSTNKEDRYELAATLALRGTGEDLPILTDLLDDPEPDVRVSAANAILQVDREKP